MLYKGKIDIEEVAQRWHSFESTHACPCCDSVRFNIRKMVPTSNYPEHWRYTCNTCKSQWFRPWQEVNTHERA